MLLIYGCANCNGCMAMWLYQEHFPDQHHPRHKTFAAVNHKLRESGTLKTVSVVWERERAIQTPDMEQHVLDHVDRDPGVCTRQVGEELNASHMTTWSVLHEQLLYLYIHNDCRVSCPLIRQHKRTSVSVFFNEVLRISSFEQCSLQMRHISGEMTSSIFTTNTMV